MPLSWNEIRSRAVAFTNEWKTEASEDAEAKSFWDDFFHVFGMTRRRLATFEQAVVKHGGKKGFIDLFWKGVLLVEHKSRGKNLAKAYDQALDYFPGLTEKELPRYILVSDFASFKLYDLETGKESSFGIEDFVSNVHLFDFIAGYEKRVYKEQDPVNIHAAEKMGFLHDQLKEFGYTGHHLELYLVRLLFCLFADNGGLFEKGIFTEYIENRTSEDGSDLAMHLEKLFYVLNTEPSKRLKNLDESLQAFPYVNGKLFEEQVPPAEFTSKMRDLLLESTRLDWGQISPAIFGSLFQSVLLEGERRELGAHYTSEKNIMKVVKALFLDELWLERKKLAGNRQKLLDFQNKLASLKFFDPACGCGNFLIVAYRELRILELDLLLEVFPPSNLQRLDISSLLKVSMDQFYGIEIEEFPSQIAQVAMWLIDHQMNVKVSTAFGLYYARLPLDKAANITHGNALYYEWNKVINIGSSFKGSSIYILGNPPFIGKYQQTDQQKKDIEHVFEDFTGSGVLDYVTAWFYKAAELMHQHQESEVEIKTGFVSTNSITQGEQVGILWQLLMQKFNAKIHFAHRTFKWSNEARGNAAVHCVIIGFAAFNIHKKKLVDYQTPTSEGLEIEVDNISPYLVHSPDILILARRQPICPVPPMIYGSKPVDDGELLFTDEEKSEFLKMEPRAEKYFRMMLSSRQFIHNQNRWCLWLHRADPKDIKSMPHLMAKLKRIQEFRLKSPKPSVQRQALTPGEFSEIRQPETPYLVIPQHSSEQRHYVPFGFFGPEVIVSNSCTALPDVTPYLFGMLTSHMHMVWLKYIGGRIKSDYRYANTLVYNNFPFPKDPPAKAVKMVEKYAQEVLDIRASYPGSSLSDLYDPIAMPSDLLKAHRNLDKAVDDCFEKSFKGERERMEYLFALYEEYTKGIFGANKPSTKRKKTN